MDTILHRRASHRHEGHDIRSPHARMHTLVRAKIDKIGRHTNGAKRRFGHGIRLTGKTQDGTMVVPIHRVIQQPHPWHGFHGAYQRQHRRLVSPLTEVGYTFDDPIHVRLHFTHQNDEAGGVIISSSLRLPQLSPLSLCNYFVFFTNAL